MDKSLESKGSRKLFNLVIGLSGPYGSGCSSLAEELVKIIGDWPGCYCKRIQASEIIKNYYASLIEDTISWSLTDHERRKRLQHAGNELRKKYPDFIGNSVTTEIVLDARQQEAESEASKVETLVYIVDSLKNISDLDSLKNIYKDEFFFCFVTANDEIRWRRMRGYRSWTEKDKSKFQEIDTIDSDEKQIDNSVGNHGQQVKKLASLADYYVVNNDTREDLHKIAYRITGLIFGLSINQPTKDEKSMHIAFSSANQSACLSRQVGAAIFSKEGNILAIGHNDVPKPRGGLYSIEDGNNDHRCLNIGDRRCINYTEKEKRFRSLTDEINKGLASFAKKTLTGLELQEFEELLKKLESKGIYDSFFSVVKNSEFKEATEYCRAVHAEMDALLSACRSPGGSTVGATVYVTTQPCHNCVKHLIAAGVERVVYIEPYPKSLGEHLHPDAISLNPQSNDDKLTKISFLPYHGLAPRRYHDIFDMTDKRKDSEGKMYYRSKQEAAHTPKFSSRVSRRARISKDDKGNSLITFNELNVAVNMEKLINNVNKEESHEE